MVRKFFCFLLLILTFSNICYAGVSIDIISAPSSASAGENLQITINIYSDVYAEGHLYSYIYKYDKTKNKTIYANEKGWQENRCGFSINGSEKKVLKNNIIENVEPGEYIYRVRFKEKVEDKTKNHDADIKINVGNYPAPKSTCEAKFIGEKYCKLDNVYQKYEQSNCSQIEKKIETCNFGCKNGVCKSNTSTSLDADLNNTTKSARNSTTNTTTSANNTDLNKNNNTTNNNVSKGDGVNKDNTSKGDGVNKDNILEQQNIEQDDAPYEKSQTITSRGITKNTELLSLSAISGMFSQTSNLSLLGMVVVLAIIGIILWKI